jgi:hypothetical protein
MKASTTIVIALLCSFLCSSLVSCGDTLTLTVSSGSNKNWIAVQIANGGATTMTVEIQQAGASWAQMTYEGTGTNAGYYTYNDWSKDSVALPLSFRCTSTNGATVVLNNVVSSFPGSTQSIDSLALYSSGSSSSGGASSSTGNTNTGSSSGCSGKPKLMVPLYVYPGAAWDAVAAGASSVKTVAIINPNNGPGGAPDASYVSYMQKLHDAGVDLVGYVYTSYGARSAADVKADINTYASQWPLVTGIFLDEGANDASKLSFYQDLHSYIMAFPGYAYNIINPGVVPDSGYANAATQIVSFENYGTSAISTASWATCSNKDQFVGIAHTASAADMPALVSSLVSKNYGYIYVTDGAGGCCTYNALTSYYAALASTVGSQ